MADIKDSALPAGATPDGTEILGVSQGSPLATVRITLAQVAILVKALESLIDTSDTRLSDARTPTAHDLDGHNSCTVAELSGLLTDVTLLVDTGDARLSDARTPTAHSIAGAEHAADTLSNLSAKCTDATLARTDAGQTFTGAQVFATNVTLGGNALDDVLLSTDLASVSDTALVTAGYVDAHAGGGGGSGDFLADGTVPMTGALEADAGTEALPGINLGDAGTGAWRSALNEFAISTAGVEAIRLDAAGDAHFAEDVHLLNGKKLCLDTDGDSYIYAVLDDDIRIASGGLLPVRVQPTKVTFAYAVDVTGVTRTFGNLQVRGGLECIAGENIGLYGATPIPQQTGVAVTVEAIHAALVALGAFTA